MIASYTPHARERMAERDITEAQVEEIINFPAVTQPDIGTRTRYVGFDGVVVIASRDQRGGLHIITALHRDDEEEES